MSQPYRWLTLFATISQNKESHSRRQTRTENPSKHINIQNFKLNVSTVQLYQQIHFILALAKVLLSRTQLTSFFMIIFISQAERIMCILSDRERFVPQQRNLFVRSNVSSYIILSNELMLLKFVAENNKMFCFFFKFKRFFPWLNFTALFTNCQNAQHFNCQWLFVIFVDDVKYWKHSHENPKVNRVKHRLDS